MFAALVVDGAGRVELWYGAARREPLVTHFDEVETPDANASMAFVRSLATLLEGPFEDEG